VDFLFGRTFLSLRRKKQEKKRQRRRFIFIKAFGCPACYLFQIIWLLIYRS